jgi:drug/metabolite transporter superfamily protein YnfA
MSRTTSIAVGAVLVLFGAVWFLQGVDVLGGSGMSGKTLWAVVGPLVALVGVAVLALGLRRRR